MAGCFFACLPHLLVVKNVIVKQKKTTVAAAAAVVFVARSPWLCHYCFLLVFSFSSLIDHFIYTHNTTAVLLCYSSR